jgi:pimeloyl-ACP methyl ester carboxylesterase/quinol monooxygenase YgiN
MFEVAARLKIRDGEFDGFKQQAAEVMKLAREQDTKTLRYDWFINADETECEVREGYLNADGLFEHNEHVAEARDSLFRDHAFGHDMTIYGEPSPALAELIERMAGHVTFHRYALWQSLDSDDQTRRATRAGREETAMFEATAHLKIRAGQLEGFKKQAAEIMRQMREQDEPPLRYDWFLSDDGIECEVREAYVNADALLKHQQTIAEAKMNLFREFVEAHTMTFYGEPSPALAGALQAMATPFTTFSSLQGLDADVDVLQSSRIAMAPLTTLQHAARPEEAIVSSVSSDGCDLYYKEIGEGVPILLIHPSGATSATWGSAAENLARIGRVIAYDRRGYARSGGEPVHSMSTHTADAAALLDSLRTPPAVVVGTSAGAAIALDLAVRRPDLVRVVIAHEFPWRFTRHLPALSQVVALAKIGSLALRGRESDAAEALLRSAYSYRDGASAWDAFPEGWRRIARENAAAALADFRNSIGVYPSATDLANVQVPVVCSYGARSPDSMARLVRLLASAIPTATTRRIDGAGHAAPFDATENFVQVIADAINPVEAATSGVGATA